MTDLRGRANDERGAGLSRPGPLDVTTSFTTRAEDHMAALTAALSGLASEYDRLGRWGHELVQRLTTGSRLLVAGNGGSAAQAQHLTAELVGRYRGERRPLSALALHAETSTVTAVVNDYGPDAVFSRQVEAHGRQGDVLLLLSTSGRSTNLLEAARAARRGRLLTWAITGRGPNPLAGAAHEAICVPSADTAAIQEVHQVVIHLLCEAVDELLVVDPELAIAGVRE